MDTTAVTASILVAREDGERSVIVRSGQCATVVDIPRDPEAARAILGLVRTLAPAGINTVIWPTDAPPPEHLAELAEARIVRPAPIADADWAGGPQLPPELGGPAPSAESMWRTACADEQHQYVLEPCLGEPGRSAVRILPENVLLVCDDLRQDLPPYAHPGAVHQTLMRLREWQAAPPQWLVPRSGMVLQGDEVRDCLARAAQYLQALYELTRRGMIESHYPIERLVLTIPYQSLWDCQESSRVAVARHHDNVRNMAQEIWQRMQAEADGVTLVS